MASTSGSKSQTAKPRKRVDAGPPSASNLTLKRGSNGSAFIRCDSCNKDIPAATSDMHDCMQDAKTKAVLGNILGRPSKLPAENPAPEAPLKEKNEAPIDKKAKRKAESQKSKKPKKVVKGKDPNEPKRSPTAFFLFMDEFRKTYKENNPDSKGVAMVAKDGGEKWKSMSDEEKACFVTKAASLKEEYQIAMEAYKASKKIGNDADDMEERCDENDDPAEENNGSAEENDD